ncbi:MAG TPA: hypothetical protein VK996_04405 [Ramlibacter sp.]|nr:hypothetical protein [Ramlibacter sp.]
MMQLIRLVGALLLAALMTACGGGGGSAGTTVVGGGGGSGTTLGTPTVALEMVDGAGAPTSVVTASGVVYAKATVKNGNGVVSAGQVVTFTSDGSLVKFLPISGTALTDSSGVAMVQVQPASASAAGAGTLTASASVNGVAATPATFNFSVPLGSGNSSSPTLALGLRNSTGASTNIISGTTTTTARVTLLDGAGLPVAGTVVTFSGDPTLIKFSPAGGTVLTDASGVASITVSPASALSAGAGTLRASALVGTTPVSNTFDYQLAGSTGSAGVPTLTLVLQNAAGANTNTVSVSGVTTAKATVLDAAGAPVVGKIVTFSGNTALIKLNPASGQVLTDSTGVASVQVTPASLNSAGAGSITASTSVGGTALNTSFDFQLSAANLALQSLNLGSGSLPAFGNRPISVVATINGVPATNTPIQVTFSASCGTITPAVVVTDGSGVASSTYKADNATCAGSNVTVSASAVGATSLSGTIAVQSSLATNIQFLSATPQLIYLAGSVGPTQAQVGFRVVDSNGNPLQNQQVLLSLVNSGPGVSLNTVGNTAPVTLSTDAAGLVSLAVFSGTVPTSVQVRATLVSNSAVLANSNVLTVASGRPVQRATSVALQRFSIEGLGVDGATSTVTISLADRQGNPVPDGTQVNFTTRYGILTPATCLVAGGTSSCTVTYRSQGDRASPFVGRAAILAYVPGEEDFTDLNGNNIYDSGEPFIDLGNAYRDEYLPLPNGVFDAGEFVVPRAGSSTCLANGVPNGGGPNGVPGTCDGVWGIVDVRMETMIQLASSSAVMFTTGAVTTGGFTVRIQDVNGNSMPTGSTIAVSKISGGGDDCTVASSFPAIIPNTYSPTDVSVNLDKCFAGGKIGVNLTTPGFAAAPTTTQLVVTLP